MDVKITTLFILSTVYCFCSASFKVYLDQNERRMAQFYHQDGNIRCNTYGDSNIIHEIIDDQTEVSKLDAEEMNFMLDLCSRVELPHVESSLRTARSIIFPGTKWCGAGNSSEHYDDLGLHWETDMCCREHDHCPDTLKPGETKYGLTNPNIGSISHCDCDTTFYNCLKSKNNKMSDKMGKLFFDGLGQQCFKLEHPIISCIYSAGLWGNQCQQYELDYLQEKVWQLFDAKLYSI